MTSRSFKLASLTFAAFALVVAVALTLTRFIPAEGANWDRVCQRATESVRKVKGGYLVTFYGARKVQDNSEMITCNNGQRVHL